MPKQKYAGYVMSAIAVLPQGAVMCVSAVIRSPAESILPLSRRRMKLAVQDSKWCVSNVWHRKGMKRDTQ